MPTAQSPYWQHSATACTAVLLAIWVHAASPVGAQNVAPRETDPIVVSIQARNPQTPDDLANAIGVLLDVGRSDLARPYLTALDARVTEDAEWFKLARKYGSQFVYRLNSDAGIQPLGRTVSEKILAASQRVANDPARLEGLTRRLADPEIVYRSEALADLKRLGEVGAAAILNVIGDPARSRLEISTRRLGSIWRFSEGARFGLSSFPQRTATNRSDPGCSLLLIQRNDRRLAAAVPGG